MTPPTGLYVHWPFCSRICPYCDFTVTRSRHEDAGEWGRVFLSDLERMRDVGGARSLKSIYFGGGTPSLMPPGLVAHIIDLASEVFGVADGAEITLEANPTDAEMSRVRDFRQAGVNRISLGVQSFDDAQLEFLGRNHSGGEALRAVEVIAGEFDLYTLDFIYALPCEAVDDWRQRLSQILAIGAPHLSFYQLTVEPRTAFAKAVGRGAWRPAEDDQAADLFDVTQEMTAAAGCPAYEVSNHARPGLEAVHNSLYWQGADWIGIGPGAHGRLTVDGERLATAGEGAIRDWLSHPFEDRYSAEKLDTTGIALEVIAGGLRTTGGMPLERLPAEYRQQVVKAATPLVTDGLLSLEGGLVVVPPRHRLLTDYIAGRLAEAL